MVTIPAAAAERAVAVLGESGRAWLRGLSDLTDALLADWALTLDGEPFPGGYASLVLPVRDQAGAASVLKLAPSADWIATEATALAHWRGRGAVRLERVDRNRGAMLCERALPGDTLLDAVDVDEDTATAIVADLMVELGSVSVPNDPSLPRLETWTASLSEHVASPLPSLASAAARAFAMAAELHKASSRRVVLHGDLHQGNVLRASRQPWLALDPKGLVGPPAADAAAYIRNPRRWLLEQPEGARLIVRRMDCLAERTGEDVREIAGWAYVMAVLSAAWAVEDHESPDVVDRAISCAALLDTVTRARS